MRFVDTSFWYALADGGDFRHADARAARATFTDRLVTSNAVLGEMWTLLRRRAGHSQALRFLDAVGQLPELEVARIDERLEADAWRWLRSHDEREYSFVDATSFALMRSRRIREALAFDGDFTAAGFIELRA